MVGGTSKPCCFWRKARSRERKACVRIVRIEGGGGGCGGASDWDDVWGERSGGENRLK